MSGTGNVTHRMRLVIRYARTAEEVEQLLAADAEYRSAAELLKSYADRYDDVYLDALSRYTKAEKHRASVISRVEGRSHG